MSDFIALDDADAVARAEQRLARLQALRDVAVAEGVAALESAARAHAQAASASTLMDLLRAATRLTELGRRAPTPDW